MKGVEDALRRLEGAADVTVDLQAGRARIAPRPGARIAPGDVRDALRHAGFPSADVEIEASGTGAREGGRWVFRLPGDQAPYLEGKAGPEGPVRIRAVVGPAGDLRVTAVAPKE